MANASRPSSGRTVTNLTDELSRRIPSAIAGLYQNPDEMDIGLIMRETLMMKRPLAIMVDVLFLEEQNSIFPAKVVKAVKEAIIEIVKGFPAGSRYSDDTLLITPRVAEEFRNPSYTRIS